MSKQSSNINNTFLKRMKLVFLLLFFWNLSGLDAATCSNGHVQMKSCSIEMTNYTPEALYLRYQEWFRNTLNPYWQITEKKSENRDRQRASFTDTKYAMLKFDLEYPNLMTSHM